MYGIVYSTRDPAGSGIAAALSELVDVEKCGVCGGRAVDCRCGRGFLLAGFDEDVIFFEFLDAELPGSVEAYVFLSRHSSRAGVKSYTVHHTGNPGPEAPYGGRPRELSYAPPPVSHMLLRSLYSSAEEAGRLGVYEVSYEATHHGPTGLSKPLAFIEIGSSIEEWREPVNHRVVAEAVARLLEKGPSRGCRTAIGIGGGHYPRKHSRRALETSTCYGHILAKYALPYLDEDLLEQMVEKTVPSPGLVVVEKKGTRREHRALVEGFVEERGLGLEYI